MAGNGPGGTPFESMSHEQMLEWLDQAKSGEVQAAADRLTAAAEEIRKIAGELKVRPQYVAWKGEGADAFRMWAADLANSTLRMGDFTDGVGNWLTQASGAIATAQVSIPRDAEGAQANLGAARAAHNDPDSATVSAKARSELAALGADKEKVRLEAAAQMRKLGQTYELSATQLNALERPKFPPPPAVITPRDVGEQSTDLARPSVAGAGEGAGAGGLNPGVSGGRGGSGGVTRVSEVSSRENGVEPATSPVADVRTDHLGPRPPANGPVAHVAIDSVGVVPEARQKPVGASSAVPEPAHPGPEAAPLANGESPPVPGVPAPARTPSAPMGQGRSAGGGRLPTQPGQRSAGSVAGRGLTGPGAGPSRGPTGPVAQPIGRTGVGPGGTISRGVPTSPGITGGRPAATSRTVGPVGRLPGGTVVGGEAVNSRGPAGGAQVAGSHGQPGAIGSSGAEPGRRAFSPRDGITGGRSRQTGRTPARPGAPVPSAPTRGGITGGVPSETGAEGGPRSGSQRQRRNRRGESPAGDG